MKSLSYALIFALLSGPVAMASGHPAHTAVSSADRNREIVLSFWRDVIDARNISKAAAYLDQTYIRNNPCEADGLDSYKAWAESRWKSKPAVASSPTEFITVLADGDYVQLVTRKPRPDPHNPGASYMTYWFDLFRLKDGKIIEHWDAIKKAEASPECRLAFPEAQD
ncbi:nuclear transport factor 2 family protein [Govanella unica]|uniref:SnoaL-like domain-containing protein n=1 Tax=Govanella unica TaxID=2975056 RepID=A0A9X3Z8G1_9PROT|nr:ester cyclase [Govania unica]MDA5195046.1 hypothetical protein [Govania unica]